MYKMDLVFLTKPALFSFQSLSHREKPPEKFPMHIPISACLLSYAHSLLQINKSMLF